MGTQEQDQEIEGRPDVTVIVHVEVYSENGEDTPYLLMALREVETGKMNRRYMVTWEPGDTKGYDVSLDEVCPRPHTGSVRDPQPIGRGRIRYKVDISNFLFEYDLIGTIEGYGPCEAYAERPQTRPTCSGNATCDDKTDVDVLMRDPPPKIRTL